MKIKIKRTYEVETVIDVPKSRLAKLDLALAIACENQTHEVVEALRALDGVHDAYGSHDGDVITIIS